MTKKHFQAIASILKDEVEINSGGRPIDIGARLSAKEIAQKMADYFKSENANFDRARFLSACGLD